jgi:hypothetical protein
MKNFYLLFLLFFPIDLHAQNYTVSSLADDASNGTFRWAINQANSNLDLSVIDFDASLNGSINVGKGEKTGFITILN